MDRNNSNNRTTAGVIAATMLIASVALFALAGLTGSIGAAGGENAGGNEGEIAGAAVSAASVTDSINYQGRLTDSSTGEPLFGTYWITFRLYNSSTGGTALATDAHDVEIVDGLFNTHLDFDQSHFDGGELWLGVTVGTDSEMTPRQDLRPVPYALSLVPGADIIGSALVALHAESSHTSGKGIRGYATAASGANYGVVGASKSPDGYGGYFYNNEGGIGVYGEGKYGGYFTTNQDGAWGDHNAGVNMTTTYDYSDGVHASTTGYSSDGLRAATTGNRSEGVYARTYGGYSNGVLAATTGGYSDGVRAVTCGDNSHGVYAHTEGYGSDGVRAYSDNGYGVYGEGKYGGYFTTNQDGTWFDHNAGVDGSTDRDYSDGVCASTTGDYSHGVQASTTGYESFGVDVYTSGDCSHGVYVSTHGDNSKGVFAYSANNYGVYARTDSADSAGVYARGKDGGADLILGGNAETATGDNGNIHSDPTYPSSDIVLVTNDCIRIDLDNDGNGEDADFEIYDKDDDCIFDVDERGDVYADGSFHSGGADVAEYFPTPEDPEPGTVMTIDPAGGSRLRSSTKAYDTTVAGIVSTEPGVSLGTKEDGNDGEKLIAVAGRVQCKVDASYAAIKPGDLLTTSDTPGHAMKATDPAIGTILGKALEPLDSGTGTIEVLVTLQ